MPPPKNREVLEEPIPAANPVSGSNLPHIPRSWIKDAIRVLHGDGYTVSGAQAYDLLRRWQQWRRADAERFIAEEFRMFAARRGDLTVIRGKAQHGWRVSA